MIRRFINRIKHTHFMWKMRRVRVTEPSILDPNVTPVESIDDYIKSMEDLLQSCERRREISRLLLMEGIEVERNEAALRNIHELQKSLISDLQLARSMQAATNITKEPANV